MKSSGKKWALLLLAGLALVAAPAIADTVELKNGRKINGRVLLTDNPRVVRIQVENGSIDLPRGQVADVVESPPPEDQYGERFQKTDLDDPDAVEALATWARSIGLENRARDLRELALGVRLEKRAAEARQARDAIAFLKLEEWAKSNGLSLQVRRFLVDSARKIDARSVAVKLAHEKLASEETPRPVPKAEPAPGEPRDDGSSSLREGDRAELERVRLLLDAQERERQERLDRSRYWHRVVVDAGRLSSPPPPARDPSKAPADSQPEVVPAPVPLAGAHAVESHPVDSHAVVGHPVEARPVPSNVVTGHPVAPPPATDPSSTTAPAPRR